MTLTLKSLSTAYGKSVISKSLNADFHAGEFIGLVGPNGSGKSCLLKTIASVNTVHSGSVEIDGQTLSNIPLRDRAKRIAYLAQGGSVSWPLPVCDIIALGRAPYRGPLGRLSKTGEHTIEAAIDIVNCRALIDTPYDRLSGGEQARVNLARALAVDADILLADEPTNHLDPYYQLSIMGTLQAEAKRGKTVIAAVHDLRLAKRFCSRILVLNHGDIIADAKPGTALSENVLASVFKIKDSEGGFIVQQMSDQN